MQCGGLQAIEEVIAPIKLALSRQPDGFRLTQTPGIRIASTKLRMNGPDVVLSHTVWFRINMQERLVTMLWVEITGPDNMDWPDTLDDEPF